MFQLIKNYVSKLTKDDVKKFTLSKGINLSEEELDFTYRFIKKNYALLYATPNIDLTRYKNNYTEENFKKIMSLIKEAKIKYAKYLN